MTQVPPVLRILTSYDEQAKCWVAQCVDFDMVTQAKTEAELPKAFGHVFYGTLLIALERGVLPALRPAPVRLQEEWRRLIKTKGGDGIKHRSWEEYIPEWAATAIERALVEFRKKSARPVLCGEPEELALIPA